MDLKPVNAAPPTISGPRHAASLVSKRTRAQRVRNLSLRLAIVLIVIVAFALWSTDDTVGGDAPSKLVAYKRTQVVTAPQAVAQMSQLHGKAVGIVDGYIATYRADQNSLVAYVGQMASPSDAEALNKLMENRIARGNAIVTGLKSLKIDGTRVLFVKAGPETHYFWAVGSRVIWLAFDKDDPPGLHAAMKAFK